MPVSETYCLEVSAYVSLKVATKGFFRGKKFKSLAILRLKQKRRS